MNWLVTLQQINTFSFDLYYLKKKSLSKFLDKLSTCTENETKIYISEKLQKITANDNYICFQNYFYLTLNLQSETYYVTENYFIIKKNIYIFIASLNMINNNSCMTEIN